MQIAFESPDETLALVNEDNLDAELLERDLEVREINDQINEITQNQETIETACTAIEELSDMSSIMSVNNAVEVDAASMAAICAESICKRLGYVSPRPMLPTMESFSYGNSRKQATEYVVESFSDTISDIWEAVKAFFKKLVEKIMDILRYIGHFISKMLRNMGILRKQVEAVYENKDPVEVREVDFSPFCQVFNIENAVDLNDKVTKVLTNSINVTNALKQVHDAMSTFYKVALEKNDVITLMRETYNTGLDHRIFHLDTIEDNNDFIIVGEFVKVKHLKFTKREYKIEVIDGKEVEVSDPMLKVNKELDLIKLLNNAEKLADAIDTNIKRSEKRHDGFKDLTETIVKAATKIANKFTGNKDNKEAAQVFKHVAKTTVTVTSSLLQLVTENLNESVKYIEFCKRELVKTEKQ